MNRDLGVWTADDCALVLIDYQKEMFEVIRSETSADLVELHVRLLARTAKAFDMPILLSTVGVEYGFNGPTLPSILSDLDGIDPIDRASMNAFATPRRTRVGPLDRGSCERSAMPVAQRAGLTGHEVSDARDHRRLRRSNTAAMMMLTSNRTSIGISSSRMVTGSVPGSSSASAVIATIA
jgi:hypothetical protein